MTTKITPNLTNIPLGTKNVVINGNFDIWQRGTSFAAIVDGTYTADRFAYRKAGTVVHTVLRSVDAPTYAESGHKSNYSLLLDVTTADATIDAGDFCFISYKIEGYDYWRTFGGDATLSFWVKGAKTGIHCVAFNNSGLDRNYVTEYTINTADTWEKKTITVPLTETGGTWDTTTGNGLRVSFILAAGTTFHTTKDAWQTSGLSTSSQVNELDSTANNFRIAQVQFEKGNVATSFQFSDFGTELLKCLRYYYRTGIISHFTLPRYDASLGLGYASMQLPVVMRAVPTFSATTGAAWNAGAGYAGDPVLHAASTTNVTLKSTLDTAISGILYLTAGKLAFDAEL